MYACFATFVCVCTDVCGVCMCVWIYDACYQMTTKRNINSPKMLHANCQLKRQCSDKPGKGNVEIFRLRHSLV